MTRSATCSSCVPGPIRYRTNPAEYHPRLILSIIESASERP